MNKFPRQYWDRVKCYENPLGALSPFVRRLVTLPCYRPHTCTLQNWKAYITVEKDNASRDRICGSVEWSDDGNPEDNRRSLDRYRHPTVVDSFPPTHQRAPHLKG
ncbi:hypothetical protein EVAR_52809_1 [Eumeta japonica]|uniref:Uncharacterized protein n=1 Tax=Eumeta variegata TaxID=151549 RepID=A0A4C1Y3K2_EUMVA|nr:hypothetical protein EVAR_52809_1 [Eumeta japonica]